MSPDSFFTEVVSIGNLVVSVINMIGFAIFLHYINKNTTLLNNMLNRFIFLLAIVNLNSVILAITKNLFVFESNTFSRNLLRIVIVINNTLRTGTWVPISIGCLMRRYGRETYKKLSIRSDIYVLTTIVGITISALIIVPVFTICQDDLKTCLPKYLIPMGMIFNFGVGGIQVWLVTDLIIRKRRCIKKWIMDKWNKYNNIVVEMDSEEVEERVEIQVYDLKHWNEVKQKQEEETKELAGVITLCLTVLLNSIAKVIHMKVGTEESELPRGFIKSLALLATIFLWNFMNEELWNHSKVCIHKPFKKLRNLCHFM